MTLFYCEAPSCTLPSVRDAGCTLCDRHLCRNHLQRDYHSCPNWQNDDEVDAWQEANNRATQNDVTRLVAKLNVDALRARASSLKSGIACSIPSLEYKEEDIYTVMGGMNYHIPINFADGDSWICRIRRENATSPPRDINDHVILSEVASMRFLASTSVPVPIVHDFALPSASNPLGLGYILMDRLNGKPLEWYDLDDEKKKKVLDKFADYFIELSRYSFSSIGCLLENPDRDSSVYVPGPLVVSQLAEKDGNGDLSQPGPFQTELQYREEVIKRHLHLIRSGQVYPKGRLEGYLAHLYLLECVQLISQRETAAADGENNRFFLKHMDDKGDHILVNDDLDIVGIIDWEWAQTVPKSEAFAAPLFLIDVGSYYDGHNALSTDETLFAEILAGKGYQDLAHLVRRGRLEHRLAHCIGINVEDTDAVPKQIAGLHQELHGTEKPVFDWEGWKKEAILRYRDDEGLQEILREEGAQKRVD